MENVVVVGAGLAGMRTPRFAPGPEPAADRVAAQRDPFGAAWQAVGVDGRRSSSASR